MSSLIVDQEACDRLADRMWEAQQPPTPPVTGRRRGRVSITHLARIAWAPVNYPRHRKDQP